MFKELIFWAGAHVQRLDDLLYGKRLKLTPENGNAPQINAGRDTLVSFLPLLTKRPLVAELTAHICQSCDCIIHKSYDLCGSNLLIQQLRLEQDYSAYGSMTIRAKQFAIVVTLATIDCGRLRLILNPLVS